MNTKRRGTKLPECSARLKTQTSAKRLPAPDLHLPAGTIDSRQDAGHSSDALSKRITYSLLLKRSIWALFTDRCRFARKIAPRLKQRLKSSREHCVVAASWDR